MRLNSFKGFTLAELMVIMAILTILLAAFAPIFTAKYTNPSIINIWNHVSNNSEEDIYYDSINKNLTSSVYVGVTPVDISDIRTNFLPYSKVIIRSSNALDAASASSPTNFQPQIEFRFDNNNNSNTGSIAGFLFAGNGNLFLGGKFKNLNNDTQGNTALGIGTMNSARRSKFNSVIGYLVDNFENKENLTYIGQNSSGTAYIGNNSTIIERQNVTANSINNVIIGDSTLKGNRNTSVGQGVSISTTDGDSVAVGYGAKADGAGSNTAVGAYALPNLGNSSKGNTGIGINSCLGASGSYSTCIGSYPYFDALPASSRTNYINSIKNNILSDSVRKGFLQYSQNVSRITEAKSRVYIGTYIPKYGAIAPLEIHNLPDNYSSGYFTDNNDYKLNNSSVVVNGNLIVRGQPYFLAGSSLYQVKIGSKTAPAPSLMGFELLPTTSDGSAGVFQPFAAIDGNQASKRMLDTLISEEDNHIFHLTYGGHENCSCAISFRSYGGSSSVRYPSAGVYSYYWTDYLSGDYNYLGYYGWDRDPATSISTKKYNYMWGAYPALMDSVYQYSIPPAVESSSSTEIDLNRAYGIASSSYSPASGGSCCPILTRDGFRSDIRLKNVGEPFGSGLDELRNLKVYNYFYKFDPNRAPKVGVIAQDLKKVFKNSVFKANDGYYSIRWDEMFYSAINSVKQLYAKIEDLSHRVKADISRINQLKNDNKNLEHELNRLTSELEKLENK